MTPLISPLQALILGVVEGLTEFLPVSSTGHLVLASDLLRVPYDNAGVKAFEVVIQAGALLAVIGYYREQVVAMVRGLAGRDPAGLRLLIQLFVAFLPAAVIGLLAEHQIKGLLGSWTLFGVEAPWPSILALATGGVAMIGIEMWRGRRGAASAEKPLAAMTLRAAFIIGCVQVLAMWPGTSRSMTTIIAALLLRFSAPAAAEFSFLLALPTLGAATVYEGLKSHAVLLDASGPIGLAIGFLVSMVVAWLAVKGFLGWLKSHGLMPFGFYRILIAGLFVLMSLS